MIAILRRRILKPVIFIVDDNESLTQALALNLRNEGYHVQVFHNATDFLDNYTSDPISCLLLDVRMPGMTGDELQEELISRNIQIPIIFMSGYSDVPVAVEALRNGAIDFLTKPIDQHTLLKTIHQALHEDISRRKRKVQDAKIMKKVNTLTKREREVMDLIVKGKLSKGMAIDLKISINTIENHRAGVMHKMGVKTIADLVCLCLTNSLVKIEGTNN